LRLIGLFIHFTLAQKGLYLLEYTFQEYLGLEAKAAYKSEFWDGTIVALAGGTPNHSKIANSIGTAIDNELDKKNKNYTTYNSDLKVFIPAFNRGVYPDCMVLCGEEDLHENSKAVITIAAFPLLKNMCWFGKRFLRCKHGTKRHLTYGVFLVLLV